MKYKIKIHLEYEVEAEDKWEAKQKVAEQICTDTIYDNMEVMR